MSLCAEEILAAHQRKELLRFLTCGSVDDGKSTLIGRMLFDADLVHDDQRSIIEQESARMGHAGEHLDLSLLTDGLHAEREQGITIDVAFRYFSTSLRKFIIADTPGHEQFTRNMVTGASTCDLAVVLIDARRGLLPQSRRHTTIVSLLGIKHIVVAVNKMDLVDFRQDVFERIRSSFTQFAAPLGVSDIHFIPISALNGDNVVQHSLRMPWFVGRPLLEFLETVHIASDRNLSDFRFPVQRVVRPDASFRGYAGTVASGSVSVGDEVLALPSGRTSRVASIVTYNGSPNVAFVSQAVTLTLEDELDLSRGDLLCQVHGRPYSERELEATVVWMDETPVRRGAQYWLKHATRTVPATVTDIVGRLDVLSGESARAEMLALNEIGTCTLTLTQPVFYDPYRINRNTGSFILIDRQTNATAGAGMIVTRQARDVLAPHPQSLVRRLESQVPLSRRAEVLGQTPFTVWFTGLPCSGKLLLAYELERHLFDLGVKGTVLDGVALRQCINDDLTFSADDRGANVRRLAEIAGIINNAGLVSICVAVSPYRADRERARLTIGEARFVEAWCSAPVEVCAARDPEKLYERAYRGELRAFTGVSAPYEAPIDADVDLAIHEAEADVLVARIIAVLRRRQLIRE